MRQDHIAATTKHFSVLYHPTPLVEGHIMITPKLHSITSKCQGELSVVKATVSSILKQRYPQVVCCEESQMKLHLLPCLDGGEDEILLKFREGRVGSSRLLKRSMIYNPRREFQCLQDAFEEVDFAELSTLLNKPFDVPLRKRELECMSLVLSGFSAKHVGEVLKISYRTVEIHLKNSYLKLGCNGKQDVVEMMFKKQTLPLWWDLSNLILFKREDDFNEVDDPIRDHVD